MTLLTTIRPGLRVAARVGSTTWRQAAEARAAIRWAIFAGEAGLVHNNASVFGMVVAVPNDGSEHGRLMAFPCLNP
jgi:hypothetical protein